MITTDDLYQLLPAIHRLHDAPLGGPLRDLVEVLARQADVVDADLEALADAWFVETCADWLVPYLGDLLGVTPLHAIGTAAAEPRVYVARTMEYRQAKGTVAVLEQLSRDVTGWPARAVEMFGLLAWTQHVNHVRPERSGTPDLRDPEVGDLVGGPFDAVPRTAEVRRLATRSGRYNLPHIGLFVYRLQPQTITQAEAARADAAGRWHLDPLGRDLPLFNPGRADAGVGDLAGEWDLPGPLRRRPLAEELESLRDPRVIGDDPVWFPPQRPAAVIEIRPTVGVDWEPVAPQELVICDLTHWRPPPESHTYPDGEGGQVTRPIRAAVDPRLGRVAFRSDADPGQLRSGHTYAQPMPLGGGPYDRDHLSDPEHTERARPDRRFLVGRDLPVRDGMFRTLSDAAVAWRGDSGGRTEIVVTDSAIYDDPLQGAGRLELPPGSSLRIVAATTVLPPVGSPPDPAAPLQRVGVRPVLTGRISVRGGGGDPDGVGALELDGLWLGGGLTVLVGNLATLRLVDATLVPGRGDLEVRTGAAGNNGALVLELLRTVTGPLELGDTARTLRVDTAIVDASGRAIGAARADVTIVDSTVLGGVSARSLRADNVIFTGPVTVERRQTGCLRYCVLPTAPPTRTPRRYRCQPDLALVAVADAAGAAPDTPSAAAIRARLSPVFTSRRHGDPAYCQLAARTAPEIATGAEDGSEMGAYRALRQPARRSNLATALSEYLRAGLEAGALHVT